MVCVLLCFVVFSHILLYFAMLCYVMQCLAHRPRHTHTHTQAPAQICPYASHTFVSCTCKFHLVDRKPHSRGCQFRRETEKAPRLKEDTGHRNTRRRRSAARGLISVQKLELASRQLKDHYQHNSSIPEMQCYGSPAWVTPLSERLILMQHQMGNEY